MKRLFCTLMLLALLTAVFPVLAQDAQERRMEDIAALCDTLEERHIDLYAHISKEDFLTKRYVLESACGAMSDGEFAYALMELVASIADAHTTVSYYQNKYSELTALPFAVLPMEGRWYLAMIEERDAQYLCYEVTAVNGVPMDDVFSRARAYISHDTEAWAQRQLSNTINFLDALQVMGVAAENASGVTLSLRGEQGEEAALSVPGMSESEIMQAKIVSLTPSAYAPTWASGYYRGLQPHEGTFFIQYNVCQEAPDMSMAEFAQLVQPYVAAEPVSQVIIDLRYNTGGNSAVLEPLLAMLEEARAGKEMNVYTLIGGDTFSSAVINAVQTKERLGAVLVGSPTGGAVNAFGELYTFTLPNSPLAVTCSTKYIELIPGYGSDSLLPDIAAEQSYADYMRGIDTVVETVLAL